MPLKCLVFEHPPPSLFTLFVHIRTTQLFYSEPQVLFLLLCPLLGNRWLTPRASFVSAKKSGAANENSKQTETCKTLIRTPYKIFILSYSLILISVMRPEDEYIERFFFSFQSFLAQNRQKRSVKVCCHAPGGGWRSQSGVCQVLPASHADG